MIKKVPQLLKYIGNKTKYSEEICLNFQKDYDIYFEPFFGSGAVLGTLKPKVSIAVDSHEPLIDMWNIVKTRPSVLSNFYADCWHRSTESADAKKQVYDEVVASYNKSPNPFDLLFISRSCYGGVLRYRKLDGFLSTPLGPHKPIPPTTFEKRLAIWHEIVKNTEFLKGDFSLISDQITERSLIYCDPPYSDSQKILYGAQDFKLERLLKEIVKWKRLGAFVALSIDGTKFSGQKVVDLGIDENLFEKEISIRLGGSMLKRFQLENKRTDGNKVTDRLLVTRSIDTRKQMKRTL